MERKEEYLKECLTEIDKEDIARDLAAIQTLSPENLPQGMQKNFDQLLKRSKRPLYRMTNTTGKRVATIILATLAALTISTFTLYQTNAFGLKTWFDKWVSELREKYSIADQVVPQKETIETVYVLSNLPEGWALSTRDMAGDKAATMIYSNDDGMVRLHQYAGGTLVYDTEGAEIEEVKIGKSKGQYYENKGINTLTWEYDGYLFSIVSDVFDKDQIIDLAKYIQPEE